jgi:hypothetical protein
MRHSYYISPYTASPTFHSNWDAVKESGYFQALSEEISIIGIEQPFLEKSDKYPIKWMQQNVPEHWDILLTSLFSTMQELYKNTAFGIASLDETARKQAVKLVAGMHAYTQQLNDRFGRLLVKAIHLHTAPSNKSSATNSSLDQLLFSMDEISQWDWQGAQINIEHCDAPANNRQADKGFLSLADEISALQQFPHWGMLLNWGRSAIETRSPAGPLDHIKKTIDANQLRGFIFSGCTANSMSEYGQWKDSHIPPQKIVDSHVLSSESLLGQKEITETFKALSQSKQPIYYGIKVSDANKNNRDVQKKVELYVDTLKAIEYAINA